MDVLVQWEDGTENVVDAADLECENQSDILEAGIRVRMYWEPDKKWYNGKILATENTLLNTEVETSSESGYDLVHFQTPTKNVRDSSFDSEDELPLARLRGNSTKGPDVSYESPVTIALYEDSSSNSQNISSENSDSQGNSFNKIHCEVPACRNETFSACPRCLRLLCWEHFDNFGTCVDSHQMLPSAPIENHVRSHVSPENSVSDVPECFTVEGGPREIAVVTEKKCNKKKNARRLRNVGEKYVSPSTGKLMKARKNALPSCNQQSCERFGKKCRLLSNEERRKILDDFYEMGNLQRQREYLLRYTRRIKKQRATTVEVSRRQNTVQYYLPKDQDSVLVCKVMFLNTLSISEKMLRTALNKKRDDTGVIEADKRGGRHSHLKAKDETVKRAIIFHINKFPRVESHYCRKKTKREYLHPDLTIKKMYEMFKTENENRHHVSYQTYNSVFRTFNLSFHRPKKDECGLCSTYRADKTKKMELEDRYNKHIAEKTAVREIKEELKCNSNLLNACVVFDLQQVIFLPLCNNNKLFYSRRFSNYNFTIYNIKTKQCDCFCWHEGISKRGACEIASCLYMYLQHLDTDGVETVSLFSDGCSGQNKNSIVAAMLLHIICISRNIKSISLRFFEPYHGQSEGDSAHSCVSTALSKAGNLYVPSQLVPIFKLARRSNPYNVHVLKTSDFLDFKRLSRSLRILTVRTDDDGHAVDWKNMREVMVNKSHEKKIFFKTSHFETTYKCIALQRQSVNAKEKPTMLNKEPPKISFEKYKDLMALCKGDLPVIQHPDYIKFYKDLPH